MVSNLKIVKYVLETEIPEYHFSFLEILKLSRKNNLKNYYVGTKVLYFPNGETDYDKTVFKHDKYDYYYYDILHNNKKCELMDNAIVCCEVICKNVESLEEKVRIVRWNGGIKK